MTFWRSYAHLVWASRNREPLIRPDFEDRLFACLIDKAAELGCYVHAVNGLSDHIHVVISIPPKHSVAWVVKNLKGSSSHFINHILAPESPMFAWQRGYGYISLGESQCERAVAYVRNQKQHHQMNTTNSWLEKTDDGDEDDSSGVGQSHNIREPRAAYYVGDELPF
jgi:REP element-mobilizing transposase RayT